MENSSYRLLHFFHCFRVISFIHAFQCFNVVIFSSLSAFIAGHFPSNTNTGSIPLSSNISNLFHNKVHMTTCFYSCGQFVHTIMCTFVQPAVSIYTTDFPSQFRKADLFCVRGDKWQKVLNSRDLGKDCQLLTIRLYPIANTSMIQNCSLN